MLSAALSPPARVFPTPLWGLINGGIGLPSPVGDVIQCSSLSELEDMVQAGHGFHGDFMDFMGHGMTSKLRKCLEVER